MNITDKGLPKCWGGGGSIDKPKPGKPFPGLDCNVKPGNPGPKPPHDICDIRPTEEPAGKLPDLSAAFG